MKYDVIVIGAGHAGCEAALACSRIGLETLILTTNLDNVAYLACNPSIGGTAKGHIVREIDALGGEMGLNADATLLQLRMLNLGKGVAVNSLRAQTDKYRYHARMKSVLENAPRLRLYQGEAVRVVERGGKVSGVTLATGESFSARAVVLATGVYLCGEIIIGEYRKSSGPSGFAPASGLSASLVDLGFDLRRFKTGTPARVDRRSIDFSKMERQDADEGIGAFSFMTDSPTYVSEPCYLTYTTPKTHEIIRSNLHRAPMYSGAIKGVGPRYCPSIEDKVVRFADKERHQIFIEPEGRETNEMYVQGMSTSMPVDVQEKMYRSVIGLENVVVMRSAYAIEYDCINPEQLTTSLACKHIAGLYCAGQINGSSGYEEAGGQGIVAGINAALYVKGRQPLELLRSDAYIGVLIDDLVTKGTGEPYRMMTSRAEFRLQLRQDNADARLTELGRRVGLVSDERYDRFMRKYEKLNAFKVELERGCGAAELDAFLREHGCDGSRSGMKLRDVLRRPEINVDALCAAFGVGEGCSPEIRRQAETDIKYEGYIRRQQQEIDRQKKLEKREIPADIDYTAIKGLRTEAIQKLCRVRPQSVGQAGRISGVSPADIAVLLVYLSVYSHK